MQQRDLCIAMSVEKRTTYYRSMVGNPKGDQKSLFKMVNNILGRNKLRCLPTHSDSRILANEFNNFFKNKIQKLIENIPNDSIIRNIDPFEGEFLDNFSPVDENELQNIISEHGIKTF